ncbi:uncharacterized protein [Triticum aestivum]|uniref:uncharacterized protein isoform X2 n=1 Tax=Triticum aestivum TaxID=4565 RepID=UPI001D029F3C|nr:uncharacterized protein LOC123042565 isoform X2 [Triticum aestivum]
MPAQKRPHPSLDADDGHIQEVGQCEATLQTREGRSLAMIHHGKVTMGLDLHGRRPDRAKLPFLCPMGQGQGQASASSHHQGTKVGYKPDVVVGGKDLEHDWRAHRGMGYFIEPLVLLGLFASFDGDFA